MPAGSRCTESPFWTSQLIYIYIIQLLDFVVCFDLLIISLILLPILGLYNFPTYVKVNGNSFRVSNPFIFSFCLSSQGESTHRGMNLLLKEQILSFRVDPFWKGFILQRNKQAVMKVVSLYKNDGNPWWFLLYISIKIS